MPRVSAPVYSLNGGEVGDEALSRLDLERLQFAGSLYSNMMPRVVGSMTFRPGLEHIADINIGEVLPLEYAYSGDSAYVPLLFNGGMRVLKDGAFISRAAVSTTVTNGSFDSFTGWENASASGASASASGGALVLIGTTQARASAKQTLSVALADRNVEHGLRLEVARGPVMIRAGTSAGGSDLIPQQELDDGSHSLAFTPTGASVYLEVFSETSRTALVSSCQIEASGVVTIDSPWDSDTIQDRLRYRQNIDVIYVATSVFQQRQIQRRSATGWSIQRYKVDDGPFVRYNGNISISPSVFTGNGTLTASRNYFEAAMVGRLFRLTQSGQAVTESFTSAPAEGDFIRISGVGEARRFTWSLSGTWSGTAVVQVAVDDGSGSPGAWTDVFSRTENGTGNYTDNDDNVVKFFRWRATSVSSGTISASLVYNGGSQAGIARVTSYSSPTVVEIEVIERFYSTSPTTEWDYSIWSDFDGWPAAVESFGGRLYWGKGDIIHGSVPDSFKSFDDEIEGDSAPIARSIGAGTDRGILWLLGLQRLLAGTDSGEFSIKASSFDEPLTAAAWLPIRTSTQGSYSLRPVECDKDGIFVQSDGTSVFALSPGDGTTVDYGAIDLTALHERICDGSAVVSIAVQRRPDTVIWFILANGEARALTYNRNEKVIAWSRVVTDGQFKHVIANRGRRQDSIYFVVTRNGTQRMERMAESSECKGGSLNCLADGFKRFTVSSPQTVFAVPHLDGLDVTVWVNGVAIHDQDDLYTVEDGEVVLETAVSSGSVVIGLPYAARWQSTKLAYGAANGTALFQKKRISQLGLYLLNTMLDGLRVGKDFDTLRKLTTTKGDRPIPAGQLFTAFDADMMSISSDWDTDSRICLEHRSPYPFTAGSLVMDIKTNG